MTAKHLPACDRAELLVGFNNLAFDNPVIRAAWSANDCPATDKCYDLLVEIWKAEGLSPTFQYPTHTGYGLDACCAINFGHRKTGNGAYAPVLYQRGEYGKLIDYCLNDVAMTKKLLERVIHKGEILNPKTGYPLSITWRK